MDVVYLLHDEEFEWDDRKAQSNIEKHGIHFEEGAEVLFDPFGLYGDTSIDEEERDFVIGYSYRQRVLYVVYTARHERKRIISARQATRSERQLYERTPRD